MSELPPQSGSYNPPPPPPAGGGTGGGFTPPPAPPQRNPEIIQPTQPPTEPLLILVLNLLLVCVGYFLVGQWQKGLVGLLVAIVVGVPTCGIGIGFVNIITGIDGFLQAQHLQAGRPIGQWTFFKDHRGV